MAKPSENPLVLSRLCAAKPDIHVLAVDDSFVDRKVIEKLLKISSCKVTVVDSGKRALQLLGLDQENNSVASTITAGLNVHLVITDYSMPEMTGYDLLRKIKESSTFREVPVVIMSSENILARIDRCLEGGAKEYIIKPVKLSDVKRIKEFIIKDKGGGSCDQRSVQDMYPSPSKSFPSSPAPSVINPVLFGFPCPSSKFPCPSSKCNCRSRHLRLRNRSSKFPSELSPSV